MRIQDSYTLLFNNLWIANSNKISKLNPNLVVSDNYTIQTPPIETINVKTEIKPQFIINPEAKPNLDQIAYPIKNISEVNFNNWDTLTDQIINCTKCNLCYGRKNVVIERGNRNSSWLFVGEGPGEHEDLQGRPFVGPSGQLLDKMISAMKLNPQDDVYICNVVKCRPPFNRNPEPSEIDSCKHYLLNQIELVKPKIIITLGRFASQTLLNTELAIGKLRNKVHYFKDTPLIITYHPSYLLRNADAKKDAWADLQLAMKTFGELV